MTDATSLDPRTPVLVGVGQWSNREGGVEPVDMMAEVVRRAAADAGAPRLAARVDSMRVVGLLSWRYRDPGRLVAERIGAAVRHTVYTGNGGSHPQVLVHEAAEDIAAGRCDIVVVTGAEAWRTRMALRKEGRKPDWTIEPETVAPAETRPDVPMQHPTEMAAGMDRPVHLYPLFESALRISAGRTPQAHAAMLGRLWSRFSEVAAANPHAWSRTPLSPEEIMAVGPRNRMVCAPYPKLLNSNNNVEQAAALLLCSAATAELLGVPRDRWVFPLAGAEAADPAAIGARPRLGGSPAIRHAAAAALAAARVGLEDLDAVDLYSCFPSAVQVAAQEIGLPLEDPSRPLTATGGLTFAGGPWNNYVTHAVATVAGRVRESGRPGLVTGNSGYLTKHAVGIYAAEPGVFRRLDVQQEVDRVPGVEIAAEVAGRATLEAWAVRYDRDGAPDLAMAALRLPDGRRTMARNDDVDTAAHLATAAAEGSAVKVAADATFVLE